MATAHSIKALPYSHDSFLSWATRVSRTQISTDNGFSFTKAQGSSDNFTLDGVLRTVQSLGLPRCPFEEISYEGTIGEGGTFSVAKCEYQGKVVAVKYIKLREQTDDRRFSSLSARLRSVLQEVCIMFHEPLAKHPTILNLLGYGWQLSGGAPLPYIVVEYGETGSLRSWLRNQSQQGLGWLRSRLTLAGDVAAGLMALHECEIIHGDLKLDNVIVFGDQMDRPSGAIAKIADFGHSILTSPEANTKATYYGTSLYNAPEVFVQETNPIELDQMHKCDIWAFGLLVWEILADGDWYFKFSWRNDPIYARTSNTTSNDFTAQQRDSSVPLVGSGQKASIEPEDSHVFGSFDVDHLRGLAKAFVNKSCCFGSEFEKSYLRPFFDRTLQTDPSRRPSDLTKLPVMRHWNENGTARLRSKLAMQLKSSELSFDMFNVESAPEISWSNQKGLLEDIQRIANWQQGGVRASVAAYQTSLCYIFGFGAAPDSVQAMSYLRKAAETSHPLALLFNERIASGLREGPPTYRGSYGSVLCQSFRQKNEMLSGHIEKVELRAPDRSVVFSEAAYVPSITPAEFISKLGDLCRADDGPYPLDLRVCINDMKIVLTLFEAAILSDDDNLVERVICMLPISVLETPGNSGEPPIIQACRAGKARVVSAILKRGVDPCVRSVDGCTILHWLFCIATDLAIVEDELRARRKVLKNILNLPCKNVFTVHQQWPLRLHGTPLAFATMTCCQAAVEILLKLGAAPMAPAFFQDIEEASGGWTPLHLAIKNHLPSICQAMLERSDLPLDTASPLKCPTTSFASALSFSSVVERYCIHEQDHPKALQRTISTLPRAWLSMVSADGRTPLMQAIDFDDIAVLKSLLAYYPELAVTPLIDPEDKTQYTFPVLFACQAAGQRDYPGTLDVFKAIAEHDLQALTRVDSRGRTCLHMAAAGVSELFVVALLERKASARSTDYGGRSAIFASHSLPIFLRLLKKNRDANACDHDGLTLAHYAVLNTRLDILRELIRMEAPLNRDCPTLGTPLHCAIAKRSTTCVSALLDALSHDLTPGTLENSLLRLSHESEIPDIVREFTARGIHLRTSSFLDDYDLLGCLLKNGNVAIRRDFISKFHSGDLEERVLLLHYLTWRTDSDSATLLDLLIDTNPVEDVFHRQREAILSTTIVHQSPQVHVSASRLSNFAVIRGRTPIHSAAYFGNADALKIFMKAVSLAQLGKDVSGKTSLDLALQPSETNNGTQDDATSDVVAALLLNIGSSTLPQISNLTATSWSEAKSRWDFGALTIIILRTSTDIQESVALKQTLPEKISQVLLVRAIQNNEMGFIATCLRSRKVLPADLPSVPWSTPGNILRLYHYADLLDFHMLRWRFATDQALDTEFIDDREDYTKAGGEFRNFPYEWCMLRLGILYSGPRDDNEFAEPLFRLAEFLDTGRLSWSGYRGRVITIIEPPSAEG